MVWTCVTEDREDWHDRTVRLAASIRAFGGPLANAPIVVHVVDAVGRQLSERLARLDVETRVVATVDARRRHLNKLRMLEPLGIPHDVRIALDCDVVVTGDFLPHLHPTRVGAKPVDADPLGPRQWARLYAAMGLRPPPRVHVASSTGRPMLPYVNSGVLTLPETLVAPLLDQWNDTARHLLTMLAGDPHLIPPHRHFYLDQYALAFALQRGDIPLEPLGVACNWPLHVPIAPRLRVRAPRPVVVHYHGFVDDKGFLMASPASPELDSVLDDVNRAVAEHLGRPYGGLQRRSPAQRLRRSAERAWLRARDARSRVADIARHPAIGRPAHDSGQRTVSS